MPVHSRVIRRRLQRRPLRFGASFGEIRSDVVNVCLVDWSDRSLHTQALNAVLKELDSVVLQLGRDQARKVDVHGCEYLVGRCEVGLGVAVTRRSRRSPSLYDIQYGFLELGFILLEVKPAILFEYLVAREQDFTCVSLHWQKRRLESVGAAHYLQLHLTRLPAVECLASCGC